MSLPLSTTLSRASGAAAWRSRIAGATTAAKGKIWIDLDNSPHVPFFAPIVDELAERGYLTMLTARDAFQVHELAERFRLNYELIGRHSGRNKIRKLVGLGWRALQLMPTVLRQKPDLAVSHGSRAQLISSAMLGIPSLLIGDYEFSTSSVVIHPTWTMCPEVIPDAAVPPSRNRILKYPGIKEDVYVPRFVPDPQIRNELRLRDDDVVVTLRPPANEAHYYTPESDELFDATVDFLGKRPGVKMVAVPRNEKQAVAVRQKWPALFSTGQMRIPDHVVDGLNLIWYSDLVISGGGTMNREAAALGVPVFSVFRGKIGAVDQYLSLKGRLTLLESVEDVQTKISVTRRLRPGKPENGGRTALSRIVEHIVGIMESRARSPQRDES